MAVNKFECVQDNIVGRIDTNKDLYMVVWQRIANSGIMYVWATSEENAFEILGLNPQFVKHTIVKISIKSMPITIGEAR